LHALKLPLRDCQQVCLFIDTAHAILDVANGFFFSSSHGDSDDEASCIVARGAGSGAGSATVTTSVTVPGCLATLRVRTGHLLTAIQPHWNVSFDLARAILVVRSCGDTPSLLRQQRALRSYSYWLHRESLLLHCWSWKAKPFFNGGDLARICKVCVGPVIGEIMTKQLEWRFVNPTGDAAACEAWLRAEYPGPPPRTE
jgi:hypothetical protein